MALSVREMMLIINAEDRATRPLKKVARDLNRLGTSADRAAKRQQLIAQRDGLINKARIAQKQAEERLERGLQDIAQKRVRISDQMAAKEREISRAHENISRIDDRMTTNKARQLELDNRINGMERERNRLYRVRQRTESAGVRRSADRGIKQINRDLPIQRMRSDANIGAGRALAHDLETQRAAVSRLHGEYDRLGRSTSALEAAERRLGTAYEKDMHSVEGMHNRVGLLNASIDDLDKSSGRFSKERLGAMAEGLGHVGRSMALVGAGGTIAFGFAANAAADFDTKVNLAATQTDNFGKASKVAFNAIIDQMTKFPASADEMSASLYDIYSSTNATIPEGTKLLEAFNKAAVAGQTDLESASRGTLSIMNALKIPLKNVNNVLNTEFKAVRYGVFTFDEFSKVIGRVIPSAANMNQNLTEVGTAMAFLTRQGLSAAMASTSLARSYDIFTRPTMVKNLEKAGIEIRDQNGQFLDMYKIIGNILKVRPELAKGGVAVSKFIKNMSGTEATAQSRRFIQNALRNYKLYTQIQNNMRKKNDQFGESYRRMAKTSGVQWKVFLNTLKAIAILIGTAVIPMFMEFAKPLISLVKWFNGLDKSTQQWIVKILFLATVLTGVAGAALVVVGAIAGFIALEVGIGAIAAVFGVVLLAVVALGAAAYLIYKNWDKIKEIFGIVADYAVQAFEMIRSKAMEVWGWIVSAATTAFNAIMQVIGPVIQFVMQQFDQIKQSWNRNSADISHAFSNILAAARFVFNSIKAVVMQYVAYTRAVITPLVPYIKGIFQIIVGQIKGAWAVVQGVTRTAWAMIRAVIQSGVAFISAALALAMHLITGQWGKAWGDLKDMAKAALSGIKNVISAAASGWANLLYDAGKAVVQGLIDGIKSMAGAAAGAVGDIAGGLADKATSVLDINTPSRVFRDRVGSPIVEGIIAGMEGQRKSLNKTMTSMVMPPSVGYAGHGGGWSGGGRGRQMSGATYNIKEGDLIVHAYQEEGLERKLERAQFRQRQAREHRR